MKFIDNYLKLCYTNIRLSKVGDIVKEAAGEANMTVVTIILIGIIAAVATPIINSMLTSTKGKTECLNAGGAWVNGACDKSGMSSNKK